VDTFTIGNIINVQFLEGPAHLNLEGFKYPHKFLYIIEGAGVVTIDHRVFEFSDGSFYTFRLANTVEIAATDPIAAYIVIFNTMPLWYSKLIEDDNNFIRRIQVVEKLFPDTSETREYIIENTADKESIFDLLTVMKREIRFPAAYSNEVIINNILSIINLALRLQPKAADQETYIQRSPVSVQMMRIAEQMLNENRKVTIGEVARKLGLSEYALNKIFIKHSGITFSNFLRNTKNRYAG
jgi:AraC-like DNA-binding protein